MRMKEKSRIKTRKKMARERTARNLLKRYDFLLMAWVAGHRGRCAASRERGCIFP